jgi:hypothetical protein
MAVTITDLRTVVDEADTTTGWSSSNGVAVFTSAPNPVESTGSLGTQVSNGTEEAYHVFTADNLTDTLVYVWMLPGGVLDTTTAGGVQLVLGDGTDRAGFHVGGSDGAGFRHDDGPVVWQCFVVDTGSLPGTSTTFAGGGAGSLNANTISQIGAAFKTLAKSVGGVENCFVDIMFYGNSGLRITGGGTGTEGKFLEIAVRDRSEADHPGTGVASATGGAYGVIRELGADLFGLQAPLEFGDSAGTGSLDFEDTGQTIVFEDRGIATNKYGITVTGNATGTTSFILGTRDGIGQGSDGCSLITPVGVGAFLTASSANIDTLGIYGCTISGFNQGVTFTTDATAGPNHEIFATSFNGCSQITIGTTEFKNNTISNTTSTGTAEAAVLMNSTTNVSDLTFVSGGTGHAIEISDATNSPFSISGFDFQGYATTDGGTGNEVIVNTSGSPITINVTDTTGTVSVDTTNSTGTVTIVQNVSITVTVVDVDNTAIQGAVLAIYNSNTDALIVNDETDVNGQVTTTTSANQPVYIRVRLSTTGATRYIPIETLANTGTNGFDISITLVEDLIVSA